MGIDTVICGPGDILTAHKPNEYVTIHDLTKFEDFFINMKRFNQQKKGYVKMIKLVIPSFEYKETFINAVKDVKKMEGFVSPSVRQFADYDLHELETNFENYIVKPLIDTMNGINLPEGFVPSTDLWIMKDDVFVGRIGLRHELTDFLEKYVGHIGYMIIPAYRKQGIATEALRLMLIEADKKNIKEVLLICEEDNEISKHMIEKAMNKFGGRIDTPQERKGVKMLRYWLNTDVIK